MRPNYLEIGTAYIFQINIFFFLDLNLICYEGKTSNALSKTIILLNGIGGSCNSSFLIITNTVRVSLVVEEV